ncbi:MAG TPA: dihydroorotate dehydrogenase electron transfer subunit, partial [Feifaniaceae bacterium]|nr:dihydroorotate dehydrogenase electron transfer subunit [Feifaniaceae bacterium]
SLSATYYACGPKPMLRAAAQKALAANARLFVSLEKRMACGVGACLGCTCQTASGGKRVCKDGPVFDYREVQNAL